MPKRDSYDHVMGWVVSWAYLSWASSKLQHLLIQKRDDQQAPRISHPDEVHIHIFIIHHEIEGFENRCRDSEVWSGCNIVYSSNSASPFYVIFSFILVVVKIDPVIINEWGLWR